MERLWSLFGLLAFVGLGFAFSSNRRAIDWRLVAVGIALQIALGFLLLRWEPSANAFASFSDGVTYFLNRADEGAAFVFGSLADPEAFGYIFAVKVVPTIIFFSAFISIMYHLGVVQIVVETIGRAMKYLLGTSGAETLACSGNIFVGQTEAPLLIKPYLDKMTASELNAVMVGGFATIAGGVLAGYIAFGIEAHHLIVASVMSAPAALVMAKMMVPETERSETAGNARLPRIKVGENLLDAATRGTTDGLKLAVNVAAMLIAFISLIAVVDWILGGVDYAIDYKILGNAAPEEGGEYPGIFPGSLKTFFGTLLGPLAFIMGCPWEDSRAVGNLLGIKVCINEFVAYAELAEHIRDGTLSERSRTIATYALCGFANFGSIGIQLGGIGALAPSRRPELARLALKAMFGGALASWMTATIAGVLI